MLSGQLGQRTFFVLAVLYVFLLIAYPVLRIAGASLADLANMAFATNSIGGIVVGAVSINVVRDGGSTRR